MSASTHSDLPVVPSQALASVSYDLHEGETPNSQAARHEIDGEVRLSFADGTQLFVSWGHRPIQSCISVLREPHLYQPPPSSLDCSQSPLWRRLVGKTLTVQFVGPDRQVLCIRSGSAAVYVCSWERGHWYTDTLTIASEPPPF